MNTTAFMPSDGPIPSNSPRGRLSGQRFAVKDLIDVAGWRTGGGNPTWLKNAKPAANSAPCVNTLLNAGAKFLGKTITDELAFSLEGANAHYGTPLNPHWPDCLPGGSSSGSASAVAQQQVDFSLGTDTGGSIRIPAAWCGLYGLRPTHNAVPLTGVVPFSQSYDCIGWMSRSLPLLRIVSELLLPEKANKQTLERFIFVEDVFSMAEPQVQALLLPTIEKITGGLKTNLFHGTQADCLNAYVHIQGREIWNNLGKTITSQKIQFGETIAPRFSACADISSEQTSIALKFRNDFSLQLAAVMPADSVLVIPTCSYLPIAKDATSDILNDFYQKALCINAIAGHAGLPQITIPIHSNLSDKKRQIGKSVGLSFIANSNCDLELIKTVQELEKKCFI